MKSLSLVPRAALGGVGFWVAWYKLVLQRASKRTEPWGPEWLAVALSGALNKFGQWYLNYTDNAEESLREGTWAPDKQYVMVWHPHGAFTIAALYFVSHWWATNYPGGQRGDRYVCVAPLLLRVPILAEYLLLCHARSQDNSTFSELLSKGSTVAVQPGGLQEQVATDDSRERIFFPPKLGFIRLALKHGVPLLPVYAFGENQLYKTTSWTRQANEWCYKTLRIGTLVVLGIGGVPTTPLLPSPLMLPRYGTGLHIRFGQPVDIGVADENPSKEKIQEAFQKYQTAVRAVFDKHKDECLPPEIAAKGLEIVWRGESDGISKL